MKGAIYEIVFDGICPDGYSPLSDETECKALTGQTITNFGPLTFYTSGCHGHWTPAQTCFAFTNNYVFFVDKDCGQIPHYQTHRLVCKKHGNNFLTFK